MKDAVEDRLLDEPSTSAVLGVSPRTVRKMVTDGYLERIKVLNATRYRLSDIEEIIRRGTRGSR